MSANADTGPTPGTGWRSFSAAPHRLFFAAGAVYAVLAVGVFVAQQASLYLGGLPPWPWAVPWSRAHGFMMLHGLLALFFFGFLLTVFPRWLPGAPVPRAVYVPAWALLAGGALAYLLAAPFSAGLALAATLLMLAGHALATGACARVWLGCREPGRLQPGLVLVGLLVGLAGLLAHAAALAGAAPTGWAWTRWLGLYGFALPVVFSVAWRMVPFFTSRVTPGYTLRRTPWVLPAFVLVALLRGVAGALGLWGAGGLLDAVLLGLLLHELVVWRCWRIPRLPLLLVLYAGLGWMALGFALSAGEAAAQALGWVGWPPFRLAALHALTVGGFGTLLLGFGTRVTLGHAGHGLQVSRPVAALFAAWQVVPLLRVLPPVLGHWWPALAVQGYWSGVPWVLAFGLWLVWFGPALVRPRADGKPG